jgi:transposase
LDTADHQRSSGLTGGLHRRLTKEQQPRSAAIKERVVEVVIGDVVVRAGADVDEAHLQRVIRAVRSA